LKELSPDNLLTLKSDNENYFSKPLLPLCKKILSKLDNKNIFLCYIKIDNGRDIISYEKIEDLEEIVSNGYEYDEEYTLYFQKNQKPKIKTPYFFTLDEIEEEINLKEEKICDIIDRTFLEVNDYLKTEKKENKNNSKSKAKRFIAINPNGEKTEAKNITQFAKDNNLNKRSISACINGRQKTHKNWKFKKIK
jgi:hypothetical protein